MEINKEIWGLIYGLITLLPGFGVGNAVLISYNHADSIPYTIAAALMLNTIKEVSLPTISNNTSTQSIDSVEFDKISFFKQVSKYKILTWVIGIIIGFFLPIKMFPIEISIIIGLGFILQIELEKLPSAIIWLMLVGFVFIYTNKLPNQILLIGMILFTIPNLINYLFKSKSKAKNSKIIQTNIEVNEAQLSIAGVFSMICPGISPTLITSQLGDGTLNTLATCTCIDTFIEACGLMLLIRNISNGKSIIGMELSVANVYTLIGCTGVLLISYVIISIIGPYFINLYNNNESSIVFITSSITICNLIINFKDALIFLPIILGVSYVLTLIPTPKNLKGLTFISPILFNY